MPAGLRRMSSIVLSVLLVAATLVATGAHAASWPTFRGDLSHTGASSGTSLFTPGQGGPARVKWQQEIKYPILFAPPVADLDLDGVAEVVVTSTDIKIQTGPPPVISFNHQVEARSGADGSTKWAFDEGDSFPLLNGATVGNIDADAQQEVVYTVGNPLTGTSSTNGLKARAHNGAQQWRYADADWGLNRIVAATTVVPQTADVDAESARNEALFGVSLVDWTITTSTVAGCPNNTKISVAGSNISSFMHAVNGEGSSANESWQFNVNPGFLASTGAVADLNGDGKRDVLFGTGVQQGPVIPGCVEVSFDQTSVDDRIVAVNGASPPSALWSKNISDPPGVRRPVSATPVMAGTTAGGDPIAVFPIPVPSHEAATNDPDRTIMLALNARTGAELWRFNLKPAGIAPPAVADLDGDGQPELIMQIADRLATFRNRDGADFWSQGTGELRGIAYARSLTSSGVAVADLDSDGTKEIATILSGNRASAQNPAQMAELLVVSGADGSVEWTEPIHEDTTVGGPILADVDGDDDLLEITIAGGSPTGGDSQAHKGRVFVFEPNAPDATVTSVEVVGNRMVNEVQTVRATVRNTGTRDASAVVVAATAGGAPLGQQTIPLDAGATATVDFPWTPPSSGSQTLRAEADPSGAIRELAENNNVKTATVRILERPVAAFAISPASPSEIQTVQFVDQSTDADGSIAGRAWSCSDGFSSGAQSPTHRFADGSAYTCSLTVTDNDGLQASTSAQVVVSHVAPAPNFSSTVLDPGVVRFTDGSTHPNQPDAPPAGWSYAWDFTDDGTTDSTERSPTHDFGVTEGTFTVRLSVTDNDGLAASVTRDVDVGLVNESPAANFKSVPSTPVAGGEATFTDQSSDPDGRIVRIEVDFGDQTPPVVRTGENVAGSQIKKTYAKGGDYTVVWTVTDDRGATAFVSRVVHVCQPPGTTGPGIRLEFCTHFQV